MESIRNIFYFMPLQSAEDDTQLSATTSTIKMSKKHSKTYSNEEIAVLNLLLDKKEAIVEEQLQGQEQENEIINVRDQNKIITLTWLDGSQHEAQINWLRQLEGDYFLSGLTYLREGKLLHGDECDEWMLKLIKEKNCGTCIKGSEGTCEECAGENYGHTTEINNEAVCDNWQGPGFVPLFCTLYW